jgi:hypothetical protein
MEQLIIFLLFVAASIVSSIIQKKKKADEEAAQRELEQSLGPRPSSKSPTAARPPAQSPAQPPVVRWPRSAHEWQDQLRKMLEENAPPVVKPVILPQKTATTPPLKHPVQAKVLPPMEKSEGDLEFKSPLRESGSAYERASALHTKVEDRLRAIDQQTTTHRAVSSPRTSPRPAALLVRRLRKNPTALREAFVASLIFSSPKSLERDN